MAGKATPEELKEFIERTGGRIIYVSPALVALRDLFAKHLYLPDTASVDFAAAVMVANRLASDPVWGMVVGPSGGGKTEAVQSVVDLPEVHPLSSLTAHTLLSGKRAAKGRPPTSLLHRMDQVDEHVLVLKDFTTILSMNHDSRSEILSQLREVYDGSIVRETGMGDVLKWSGRMGFLAAVTPIIDTHHSVMAALGERFIYLRLPRVDDISIGSRAVGEEDEARMRLEFREAMREFVEGCGIEQPEVPAEVRAALVLLARRTAWVRSSVPREPYGNREIQMRPSIEAPTRVVKQLRQLWRAAVLMGHEDPLGFVDRVARDSTAPADRLQAIEFIARKGVASSTEIRRHLGLPYTTTQRIREDLEALELIEVIEVGGEGLPNMYAITDGAADLFPESEGPPPGPTPPGEERGKKEQHVVGVEPGVVPDDQVTFASLLPGHKASASF